MKLQDNDDSNGEFFVNYGLLGNQHTRELDKKFNRLYQIHEKVSINFRSSLVALHEYFEKIFYIPFDVVSANKTIANTEIRLNQLIKVESLKEFVEKYPTSVYESEEICRLKTTRELQPDTSRPILECKLSIQYIATKKLHQTECLENYQRQQEMDSRAGGDYEVQQSVKSPSHDKHKTLSDIPEVRTESEKSQQNKIVGITKAVDSNPKQVNSPGKASVEQSGKADIESIINSNQTGNASELPRLFSYNLKISSIRFDRKPDAGIWQFSFFHDKADTSRIIFNKRINETEITQDNSIVFDDLELKLFFTSHTSEIIKLIKSSDECTLCVKAPRGKHIKSQLDCNSLLIGNKEKTKGIALLQSQTEQITSMANISVSLDDLGINFNAQPNTTPYQVMQNDFDASRCETNVTRTVDEQKMMLLDEHFSYKMIEELDEWKSSQQEAFIEDLKKKELQFLDRLKSDWNEKKAKYEHELVMKSDKLTNLTKSLQDVQKNLKTKDSQHLKDEQEIERVKQELEKSFNDQVMAIRERARRMEDDLLHEMKLKDIRFEDIERCNQHLKAENFELLQTTECLRAELIQLKSNLIPKDEVEKILQELVRKFSFTKIL